jgi:hypothetical protein
MRPQPFGTSGDGGRFEALCTSYSYVAGVQGGTVLDANVENRFSGRRRFGPPAGPIGADVGTRTIMNG